MNSRTILDPIDGKSKAIVSLILGENVLQLVDGDAFELGLGRAGGADDRDLGVGHRVDRGNLDVVADPAELEPGVRRSGSPCGEFSVGHVAADRCDRRGRGLVLERLSGHGPAPGRSWRHAEGTA